MGLRSKLKGAIKRAIAGDSNAPSRPAPPAPEPESVSAANQGNLSDGEDVPWYLRDGDADGWDSTNANADSDED